MAEKEKTRIQIAYEGKSIDKIQALKKYYGIQNTAELIKILVNERAQQLNANTKETATHAT
jgi:hypothetical protein